MYVLHKKRQNVTKIIYNICVSIRYKVRSREKHKLSYPLFLFTQKAQKKKLSVKNIVVSVANAWRASDTPCFFLFPPRLHRPQDAPRRKSPFRKGYSPLHPRHLLKKVDENFFADFIIDCRDRRPRRSGPQRNKKAPLCKGSSRVSE